MKEYLSFNKMITPIVVQILFWIGASISVILGLISVVKGLSADWGGGAMVFGGFLWILTGPLFARIYCEILIVIFTINNTLTEIKTSLIGDNVVGHSKTESSSRGEQNAPKDFAPFATQTLDDSAIIRIVKEEATRLLGIKDEQMNLGLSGQLRIPPGSVEELFQILDENHGLIIPRDDYRNLDSVSDVISYLTEKNKKST